MGNSWKAVYLDADATFQGLVWKPPVEFMTTLYNAGGEKTRSSSLCGDLKCCFEKKPLHPAGSHIYQIETKSKTISIAVGFSSICKQLSALVRVSKSSLQTTVHILCLVLRLPSSELLDEGCSLSISCKPPPHLSSQLASPPLHTNRWTKGWLQTGAVKLIIILFFTLWSVYKDWTLWVLPLLLFARFSVFSNSLWNAVDRKSTGLQLMSGACDSAAVYCK